MRQRRTSQITAGTWAMFVALGLVLATVLVLDAGIYGGSWLARDGQDLPLNPMEAPFALATGRLHWSPASTVCLTAALALIALFGALLVWSRARAAKSRSRVDYKAHQMGRGRDMAMLTEAGARRAATRFGLTWPGIFLGITVAGAARLVADVESVALSIFGPRQGKSTSQVIPAVLDAPGAVVSTSNKPDVIDATRLPRSMRGTVWAFNPQRISPDQATWWWNPLTYVVDDEHAQKLADIFKIAGRGPNMKGEDPYFDNEGRDMLAALLLAAALGEKPIATVYDWISGGNVGMKEPQAILAAAEGGKYAAYGLALEAQLQLDPGQRDGIVGTAKAMCAVLKFTGVRDWVNPIGAADSRPQFSPAEFVRGAKDTLYLLSKEGGGSAAALTTALTVAVADAAEAYAMTQPFRRLPVPLIFALDEIANVCIWKDLPDKYSHFGSKGLLPIAWLQSYSQGEELWGEKGMRKIYSSATVKVIGSGLDEEGFLRQVSSTLGEYRYDTVNVSIGDRKSVSTSPDGGKEHIWSVGDLAAMPIGRAIVKRAGAPGVLIRTVRWMDTPHADAVWFSLNVFDPTPESAKKAAEAEARRTTRTRFERLMQRRTGQKQDALVDAYRAALKTRQAGSTVSRPVTAKASAASKWLQAAHHD
ncbi:type IV secretory system conjugative DNA transfer family protein [Sinomonas mesophila]|uniref:type IV secretory system conjugative DNA transfer family protein n=1 Tax=Sinomonas mesophila TaxID=1531955 RepID=UPI00098606D9|nr:type IV secretory system conjugative DNA transfer family protein [Sinomonas mesophila]